MKEFTHTSYPSIRIKLLKTSKDFSHLETLFSNTSFLAKDLIDFVPETTTLDSKYLYGIFEKDQLIGVIDLIEDYPTQQTAYIHAFFISEKEKNSDFSETLYNALEKTAQETGITSFELNTVLEKSSFFDCLGFKQGKKTFRD